MSNLGLLITRKEDSETKKLKSILFMLVLVPVRSNELAQFMQATTFAKPHSTRLHRWLVDGN